MQKLAKIVSGAQTGVDQGALQAARWIEIPYGGWIPKGRKTEAGLLLPIYEGIQEHPSSDYLKRTEANVVDSDATLVFTNPDDCTLNVAGSKESKKPGIQKAVAMWMVEIIGKAARRCIYSPPMQEKPVRAPPMISKINWPIGKDIRLVLITSSGALCLFGGLSRFTKTLAGRLRAAPAVIQSNRW